MDGVKQVVDSGQEKEEGPASDELSGDDGGLGDGRREERFERPRFSLFGEEPHREPLDTPLRDDLDRRVHDDPLAQYRAARRPKRI